MSKSDEPEARDEPLTIKRQGFFCPDKDIYLVPISGMPGVKLRLSFGYASVILRLSRDGKKWAGSGGDYYFGVGI